jgi:Tol biopolymer transport system component
MKLIRLALYGIAITLLLMVAALGLGRLLLEGELYVYTLPFRSEPAVYLMEIERSLSVPLTKNLPRADAYHLPALSPDASQIAITILSESDGDLYLLDIWSGNFNPLLFEEAGYDDQAAWSPDGRWIAYSSLLENDWRIYKVEVDSDVTIRLSDPFYAASQPSWSPDGQRIAFVVGQSLFVMTAECHLLDSVCGKNAQQLTSSAGSDWFPVWSPDGTQIAFMSTRSGRAELYVMDAACLDESDGCLQQNPRQLTTGLGRMHSLTWSAKYGLLGFISDQYGCAGLYAVQPDCGVLAGCNLVPLVIVNS